MYCPKCRNIEFNSAGICQVCGFQAPHGAIQEQPAQGGNPSPGQLSLQERRADLPTEPCDAPEPLPEWRQELSRRFQEIKSRRGAAEQALPAVASDAVPGGGEGKSRDIEAPKPVPARPARPRKPRRGAQPLDLDLPGITADIPAGQASLMTAVPALPESPVPVKTTAAPPAADVVIRPSVPEADGSRHQDIKNMIDAVMAKQPAKDQPAGAEPAPQPGAKVTREPELDIRIPLQLTGERQVDKFILLSRTLAGLVDWIVVFVCAGTIIIAADVLEGIDVLDTVSVIHYGLLLLATYFVYSLFFLGTASQTIGMMLTDLKIVSTPIGRPSMGRMLARCCVFLLGCAGFGVGLLWGCFDRQARCLHDRLSHTRIVRVPLY